MGPPAPPSLSDCLDVGNSTLVPVFVSVATMRGVPMHPATPSRAVTAAGRRLLLLDTQEENIFFRDDDPKAPSDATDLVGDVVAPFSERKYAPVANAVDCGWDNPRRGGRGYINTIVPIWTLSRGLFICSRLHSSANQMMTNRGGGGGVLMFRIPWWLDIDGASWRGRSSVPYRGDFPITNRSFLQCQTWLNNVSPARLTSTLTF